MKSYEGKIKFFRKENGINIELFVDRDGLKSLIDIEMSNDEFLNAIMDANHDEDYFALSCERCTINFHKENVIYLGKIKEIKYVEAEVDRTEVDLTRYFKHYEVDGWQVDTEYGGSRSDTGNPNRVIVKMRFERWVSLSDEGA